MRDLEALERDKNYREFLEHANDIRPSLRNKAWREMVANTAVSYLKLLQKQKNYSLSTFQFVESLIHWPNLKNDEYYVSERNDYAYEFLNNCYGEHKTIVCEKLAKNVIKFTPNIQRYTDFSVDVAVLLAKNNQNASVFSYIKYPITTNQSLFYCKKKVVRNEIFKKLRTFTQNKNVTTSKIKKYIDDLMAPECWENIVQDYKQVLFQDPHSGPLLAFKILQAKKAITKSEKDAFLIHFILKGPILGDTFNEAWRTLTEIGQNYKRRKAVTATLNKIDPLPDRIFSLSDDKKKRVITQMLQENIPEYLKNYERTCLDYLGGKKDFPNGNPTVSCRNFYKIMKDLDSDSSFVKKFDSLTNRFN